MVKKSNLVKVDNKSDAAEATSAAIKLTSQDKVTAIIGAATSGNSVAQAKLQLIIKHHLLVLLVQVQRNSYR